MGFACFSTKLIQIIRYTRLVRYWYISLLSLFFLLPDNAGSACSVAFLLSTLNSFSHSKMFSHYFISPTSPSYAITSSSALNEDNDEASRTPVGEYTSIYLPNSSASSFTSSLLPRLTGPLLHDQIPWRREPGPHHGRPAAQPTQSKTRA